MNYRLICLLLLISCKDSYYISSVQNSQIEVNETTVTVIDSSVHYFIQPYRNGIDSAVQRLVGYTMNDLVRTKPEGTLGNLFADAVMDAVVKSGHQADLCILNYGGIRLPMLPKGNITAGQVFEVMPFENEIVILQLKGDTLKQFLELVALNGGWPVCGMKMTLREHQLGTVNIQGSALHADSTYLLATSDFLANGGDKANMLKQVTRRYPLNKKVRDALMDYIRVNSPLNLMPEGRTQMVTGE